jgi:phage terminase large subunit GpA-like protein
VAARLLLRCLVPQRQTVAEWVEEHVVDPSSGTDAPVRLDPFQREPLAAMDDPAVETVVLQFPPRVGKSSLYLDYLVYCAVQKPAPVTACFATDDDVREFLEERFEPLGRRIPELAEQWSRLCGYV